MSEVNILSEQLFAQAKEFMKSYSTSLLATMIHEARGEDVTERKKIDDKHLGVVRKLIDLALDFKEQEKNQ